MYWKNMGFMAVFDNVKASDSLSQCVLCIKIFNILKRESHTFWAIYEINPGNLNVSGHFGFRIPLPKLTTFLGVTGNPAGKGRYVFA